MITNHMTFFGTNQVCVFISIAGFKNIIGVFFLKKRYFSLKITQEKGSSLDDQDLHFGEALLKIA